MARATAKDKLRVACELARRPVLAAAYSTGELSYSKVRAITRITEVDVDTDEALVEAARKGTSTAKAVDKASAEGMCALTNTGR